MPRSSARLWTSALLLCVCPCPAAAAADYVWWEGESPARTNFPAKTWFSQAAIAGKRDVLSGGAWLTSSGQRGKAELFAAYRLQVPATGEYALWCRKFWKHGPFRWRFGRGPWRTCGRDVALADNTDIRTHLCVNWVFLGKVRLPAGAGDFELRLLAREGDSATACFDCFLLTRRPFLPAGKRRPGERSGKADEGFFPFEPALDRFGDDALLDLRRLNEKCAGQSGFVRRQGDRFVLGDGSGVRFWAVNVSAGNAAQGRESVDYLARKLAKLGVNMVRYHSPLFERGDVMKVDPKRLDDLHYLVAALKKQGIYTTLSFYFPLWFQARADHGLGGYERLKNNRPFALLYFEPRMQQIHRAWAKALLTTPNPYTALPLGRDPAVAVVEIVNEDSYFFWTFGAKNIPPRYRERLGGIFGQWLAKRHGSLAKALAAWGGAAHAEDDPAAGRAGLFDAWHMTRAGLARAAPGQRRRISDQVRFLAEHQRSFYEKTASYLKKDLGYRGLVSASNWKVADAALLDALERWTYTAGDVLDRHGYFGGPHTGDGAGYSVRVGHAFQDRAAVKNPLRLPIQVHQSAGWPHIISELGWTNPNRFRAEATFIASAYGALGGIDGIYFFAVGSNFLRDTSMAKFAVSCPVIAGTFPAAALMYRRGDVAEGGVVFHETLKLADLFALAGSAAAEAKALDALRQGDVPPGAGQERPTLDPRAFYVGRVVRSYDRPAAKPVRLKLDRFVDHRAKTIRSVTGELAWDYGKGRITVNTRRSQGAAGFLGQAGRIELADATIECRNEFASILLVSLDGKPLAGSKRILIQAMTEERPYGFRAAAGRIADLGGAPFGVRRIDATVTLKSAGRGRPTVTALDENGYPADKAVGATLSGPAPALTVRLAADAVYHVVRR